MNRILIILLGSSLALGGCYYDVEEELYPYSGNCDTTSINYAGSVLPILQSNGCMSCHSGGAPSGNLSLDTYAKVRAIAQDGRLMGVITFSAGYSPMPQGGNKISECNINKIKAWINAGLPEN